MGICDFSAVRYWVRNRQCFRIIFVHFIRTYDDVFLFFFQLTTCSRQIFAFARDGGLPFSRWIYYVNTRTYVPTHSVIFAGALSLLLCLLAFAGPTAISAVFSLVMTGQYVAYSIPICVRFFGGGEAFKPGPFNLGVFVSPLGFLQCFEDNI